MERLGSNHPLYCLNDTLLAYIGALAIVHLLIYVDVSGQDVYICTYIHDIFYCIYGGPTERSSMYFLGGSMDCIATSRSLGVLSSSSSSLK